MSKKAVRLGINVDHVATVRQARGVDYPDPVEAALLAIESGADGITIHLREDRRHIQDHDVDRMKAAISVPLNLEMAVTDEMLAIAERVQPAYCCLVPEKREELTTEGGLDVAGNQAQVSAACHRLAKAGIEVSLFIDPNTNQIDASKACGAPIIELHTGAYAESEDNAIELQRIVDAADYAQALGITVNAGHGLHLGNTKPIAGIAGMNELNIGHSIIARALMVGIGPAVAEIKSVMDS